MGDAENGWLALALEADEHAAYLRSRGEYAGAWEAKAATYRRTIEAVLLETVTGAPHCVCCLKPIGVRR